jgi:hypothetical protein
MCDNGAGHNLDDAPELLTLQGAAARLGISPSFLYACATNGQLPVRLLKIGRTSYLSRRHLEAWLEEGLPEEKCGVARRIRRDLADSGAPAQLDASA